MQQLTTALRVRRLYSLEHRLVVEAAEGMTRALQAALESTGRVVVLVDRRLVYVDGRAVAKGTWLEGLVDTLERAGIERSGSLALG